MYWRENIFGIGFGAKKVPSLLLLCVSEVNPKIAPWFLQSAVYF